MRRAARLRRSSDIALLRSEGRSLRHDAFNARVRRTDGADIRLAVVASVRVGNAVVRNRARRRVREAFRIATTYSRATGGLDLLVNVRPAALTREFLALRDDAAALLVEAAT